MNALHICGLSKKYPQFSLESFDLELPAGCIMGLVGENGAGKSTVIKSVVGLIHPDSGEIRVFDRQVCPEIMEDIGVVLDGGCMPEKISGNELGKLLEKCYHSWDSQRYAALLHRLDVDANKRFCELSRGMKMKISLAAAMSHHARLLILDEATSGLDVIARDMVLDLLLDYISDGECSVLLSSHIVSDLEKVCDYVCFIHGGRRLLLEEKDELLEKYCMLHCTRSALEKLPVEHVIGRRVNDFGAEVLVERGNVPAGMTAERAGLEDIMLFFVKGEKR